MDIMSKSTSKGFSVAHVNIQSLLRHIDDLRCDLAGRTLDAVFISETWLNSAHDDSAASVNGYKLFRNDRPSNRRGGGVAIFLKTQYKARVLAKSTIDGESEFIIIDAKLQYAHILIGCIYKPPNCSHLHNFYIALNNYSGCYQHIIICGDLNINLLRPSRASSDYQAAILGLGLEIVNTKLPTHFQGEPSLLDHMLVSEMSRIVKYQQLSTPYFSNHDLIFAVFDVAAMDDVHEYYSYRDYKNIDFNALCATLSSSNFTPLLMLPIDDGINYFQNQLNSMFDTFAPLVTKKKVDPKSPWMTSDIMYLRRRRDDAFKMFKMTFNTTEKIIQHNNFKSLRNKVVSSIRKAKIIFFSRTFNSNLNTKQLWKNLRTHGINSKPQAECNLCPNELASLFFPVCIESSYHHPIVERDLHSSFSFRNVTPNDVLNALSRIRSNATGLDGVSLKFFKIILPYVVNFFTDFLNRCFTGSHFPTAWKISKVIPVPKGISDEFRPISLVPALSKLCERLMCDQISRHLDDHSLLSQFQSGFRKNHSCKTATLHVTNRIAKEIDSNNIAYLILIDFSKAFDTINHQQLLRKLQLRFGFSLDALKMIESYLGQRKSIVVNKDLSSGDISNNSGVPQGSILGPLIFSIYAEDMEGIFEFLTPHFYADDTQLLTFSNKNDIASTIDKINKDLQNLLTWANGNGLRINSKKSKCVLISRHPIDLSTIPTVFMAGDAINYEDKVVNLGIVMNSRLKWDDHIAKATQAIYFGIRCLWTSAKLLPVKAKMDLVKSLLVPHIIYFDVIVGELDSRNFDILERAFKSMVRFIYGLRKYDHISHVTRTIFGVGLRDYLQYRRLLFMFNVIKTKKPAYLYNDLACLQSTRLRRDLIIPRFNYDQYFKSFFVFDAIKWNGLSSHIKRLESINVFKEKLLLTFCIDS